MKTKICMVSVHGDPLGILGTPDTGGQCLYIKEISKQLVKLGYSQVDTYTRYWGNKSQVEEIDNISNCKVIRISCGSDKFIPKEQLRSLLPEFYSNMKIYLQNNSLDYNIVHTHYWDGGLVGTWIKRDFNIPLVHTSHSLGAIKKLTTEEHTKDLDYTQRIKDETNIYQSADAIIAESSQEIVELEEKYSVGKLKIHLIPAGVDINWFYPRGSREEAKKQINFSKDFLILSLGRLDARKGFDLFVKTIPNIATFCKQLNKSFKVMISAGDREPLSSTEKIEYDKIVSICKELNVVSSFEIIPRIDFGLVPYWYTAADIFVVPSRYETFGLVIVEAMACGTPIVATNIGGPPDIINDGVEGFTVNPEDTKLFSTRIIDVIKDPNVHKRMSQKAKLTAMKKYSWFAVTKQIRNLYKQLMV